MVATVPGRRSRREEGNGGCAAVTGGPPSRGRREAAPSADEASKIRFCRGISPLSLPHFPAHPGQGLHHADVENAELRKKFHGKVHAAASCGRARFDRAPDQPELGSSGVSVIQIPDALEVVAPGSGTMRFAVIAFSLLLQARAKRREGCSAPFPEIIVRCRLSNCCDGGDDDCRHRYRTKTRWSARSCRHRAHS